MAILKYYIQIKTLQMDVREKTLFARMMNWLIQSLIIGGVEKDMDAVKRYCEKQD